MSVLGLAGCCVADLRVADLRVADLRVVVPSGGLDFNRGPGWFPGHPSRVRGGPNPGRAPRKTRNRFRPYHSVSSGRTMPRPWKPARHPGSRPTGACRPTRETRLPRPLRPCRSQPRDWRGPTDRPGSRAWRRSELSISGWRQARPWLCSVPTVRARPRPSGCCSASKRRTRAGCDSLDSTRPTAGPGCRSAFFRRRPTSSRS